MKALLVFLGVFAFVTQAHCYSVDGSLENDLPTKNVPLKAEDGSLRFKNHSTKKISIEPVLKLSGTAGKFQLDPGKMLEIDPAAWGFGNVKIAGIAVTVEGQKTGYVEGNFENSIRFTDINLKQFVKQ